MRSITFAVALAVTWTWAGAALAFSEGGHKTVASIAYKSLTAQQRERIVETLKRHPRFERDFRSKMPQEIRDGSPDLQGEWLFQQASIWPDMARDFQGAEKSRFHRGNWHFINRPRFLRPEDEEELSGSIDINVNVEPPSSNIDAANMNVVQAIVNSSRVVADTDQLASVKAVHICWLLHGIGDLHQPLHSAALFSRRLFPQGDRGGNSIKTAGNSNLHATWDAALGGRGTTFEEASRLAGDLLARDDVPTVLDHDPVAMWDESFELAKTHAYSREVLLSLESQEDGTGVIEPIPLSTDYLQNRRRICEVAALRAGLRCASYLASVTGSSPDHAPHLAGVWRLDSSRRREGGSRLAASAARTNGNTPTEAGASADVERVATDSTPHAAVKAIQFPSYDPKFPPPAGTTTFKLSQDYPTSYDANEIFPWTEIDFRTNATSYLQSVLDYCLAGNIEVDFRGQDNATRKWFHAPWMHDDSAENPRRSGREYHHGLTSERRSRKFELHPLQTGAGFPDNRIQNWAVSLYSPRGGHTLGRIWRTGDGVPDPFQANFPDNTVTFKLLFTAAPVSQVPFLKGSKTWTANINPIQPQDSFTRVDTEVRLLQVDVAVKDPRVAASTGWIFGTFVYDGSQPGEDPFRKLVPVGLSWGDDSDEKRLLNKQGSFLNPYLRSAVINHALIEPADSNTWGEKAYVRHHGLGGRLNGPVDNPSSSCISCHGRAAVSICKPGFPMAMVNKTGSVTEQIEAFDTFFRQIRPGTQLVSATDPTAGELSFVTVDYSLQVSMGIRNYYAANPPAPVVTESGATISPRPLGALPPVAR